MRNLNLSTRLFLSCFFVSALLFCGIYFYVKGFNGQSEITRAERAFDRALNRYHRLLEAQGKTMAQASLELAGRDSNTQKRAFAELDSTGLTFQILFPQGGAVGDFVLTAADELELRAVPPGATAITSLTPGRYLVRVLAKFGNGRLVLLFPLYEFEQASRELLGAFLVAGLALLLLTTVFSQLLAREVSRPLTALRDRMRAMAGSLGLDPPGDKGDEVTEIARSYLELTTHLQTAFQHKQLALQELERYKAELLRVNSNLHRRLFQVKVLLSLWSERDKALGVKDFLSRFLEALLPGLPFEYGCVIIRPIADMGSETIFAKKLSPQNPAPLDEDTPGKGGALWTDIIDPRVKDYLLHESSKCMEQNAVLLGTVRGSIRPAADSVPITVLSFRLKQGDEPLGSVHFLTEQEVPPISESLTSFLLNLSAQVSAQLQIQALSYATRLDPLTRLYNRGYLHDRLREEVVRSSRRRDPFSLLFIDIDHFQQLSTQHGRPAADEVPRGVASLLKRSCRASDAICRFEGALLAVVLADTPSSGAKIFAENVRKAVETETLHVPGGGTLKVTISLGIASFPHDGDGVEALLAQAERALLDAKTEGRNRWKMAG